MKVMKNNDGVTLIELIISMAITAIVLVMIVLFINTAANSFKHTNEDVNLQLEAQMAVNQLSTILMEAGSITPSAGAVAPDVKYLLEGPSQCYAVYYKADRDRLYLISAGTTAEADVVDPAATQDTENQYLMAEYVSGFTINTTGNTAKISLEFTLGDSTYRTDRNVSLRNAK